MPDLYEVIENAVSDSDLPPEVPETPDTPEVDLAPETPETPAEPAAEVPATPEATPAAPVAVDPFEKIAGMPQNGPSGKENRIPYSRVKKISENAVKEARTKWEAEHLNPATGKVTEYEAKLKEHGDRLAQVDQFENIMTTDGPRFLQMLASIPIYKDFFAKVEEAFAALDGKAHTPARGAAPVVAPGAEMPEPDQQLSDGTTVYSMEGLKALLAWQAKQVEDRVSKQVGERYKGIESEWQAQQRINSVIPQVRLQIEEARTWEGFTEHEDKVVKALQEDKRLSLEGAYRRVVLPLLKDKFTTDRTKIREEILAELKGAPKATSGPTGSVKAAPSDDGGPRTIEEIIKEQVKTIKR